MLPGKLALVLTAVTSHAVLGTLGRANLSALLCSFEQEDVGGRTQIWQNGSEVQVLPLGCLSVSVRTGPNVGQP